MKVKKTVLSWILVLSLILPLCSPALSAQATGSELVDYNSMTMEEILARDESLTWVITGDSITHNANWSGGANSYGEWMEQYLYEEVKRVDDSVVLSGWGGADIRDFLEEKYTPSGQGKSEDAGMGVENFITKYNPDVITIKLGMNNRSQSTADFTKYYKSMLDSIYEICKTQYGKIPKIVLLASTPLASENHYDDFYHTTNSDLIEESTLRLRDAIESIAEEYGLLFCDLRTAFLNVRKELGEDYAYTIFTDPSDGLHPNKAGQYCIFKELSKTLGIYDPARPIFQYEYADLNDHALFVDSTDDLTYDNNYGTGTWTDTVVQDYTWAIMGGTQMASYDTNVVNRSLFRYLENAMRGGLGYGTKSYRDIHFYNLAAPGYDLATMVEKYDTLVDERNYDVFMLYPELKDVYESDYVHSSDKVETYKEQVNTLLTSNSGKVLILWTPIASNNSLINGYIAEYADAIRAIAAADSSILFFDANRFMNENMTANSSVKRNWFGDGAYISQLCAVDVAKAFYTTSALPYSGVSELNDHNLRYTSDVEVYKGKYVNDFIPASVTMNGTEVSVNISEIKNAYPDATFNIVVLPYKGAGNYNPDNVDLDDVATVSVADDTYTFEAPCADLHLAIYGTQGDVIYRYKDVSLNVATDATIPNVEEELTEVCLDSLQVMSAPSIGFSKDVTEYTVNLYSYQTYVRVKATAKAGITIQVNGEVVASGALSNFIKVDAGDEITVTASGTVGGVQSSKTYTLTLVREEYPDIIITEVMTDGYRNYDVTDNDNYELVEIYNASGKDLNLLDYSIGSKKENTYNGVATANGGEYPYYFTGNDQTFAGNFSHTGIKNITKYSTYWNEEVNNEPSEIIFKADSTMVIWIKFSASQSAATRATNGAKLTYSTLIAALEEQAGKTTLTKDINGTKTAIVPKESQLVVAEYHTDASSTALPSLAANTASNKNWCLENFTADDGVTNRVPRGWLFILKNSATVPQNGAITKDGDDIISAAKFIRPGNTDKLSSVFAYDVTRGMSNVKNEGEIDYSLIGTANTSDVMGYSNLTSFGAIEYWQKPYDFADQNAPIATNKTESELNSGAEGVVSFELTDDEDIRYIELYTRRSGEDEFTKTATQDLVLESGVLNDGLSADITSYTYSYSFGKLTDTVEYYATVVDGNDNVTYIGTEAEPNAIKIMSRVIDSYTLDDAKTYIGIQAPTCSKSGYVFAGWYTDANCRRNPILDADDVTSETVYALFVVEDVLSIKSQISSNLNNANTDDDATGSIRFITTVDSLNYSKVGFDVAFDIDGDGEATTYTRASNTVYSKLYAVDAVSGDTMEYEPSVFSSISTYFKACTVSNVPNRCFGMEFTVTPFWYTPDNIRVEGKVTVRTINHGIYGSAEAEIDGTYYNELEKAVEAANADADTTTIVVLNDAEVNSQMDITTDIIIQSQEGKDITVYRGSGLVSSDMFLVDSGVTLTIQDTDEAGKFVLDGRNYAEAAAEKSTTDATGSSGSLVGNKGILNLTNLAIQYVKKTATDGGVVYNYGGAAVNIADTVFDNNYTLRHGSVVYNLGNMKVDDSVFTNNGSDNNGGVLCSNGATSMSVDNCSFTNSKGTDGAAVWSNTTFTISNSYFTKNTSTGVGGAIRTSATNAKIENCTFTGNTSGTSKDGGAIYNAGSNLTLQNNTFDGNTAGANGGAICSHAAAPMIIDCKFINNTATASGGAFYAGTGHTVTMKTGDNPNMAIFQKNTAKAGFGGGAITIGTGNLVVKDYTFKNNTAELSGVTISYSKPYGGGAIRMNDNKTTVTPTLTLEGCVFDSNTTPGFGGAISSQQHMNVDNTKFISNTASGTWTGGAIYAHGGRTITFTTNTGTDKALFESNKGATGGAITVGSGNISISGYTFNNNSATNAVGGGAIRLNDQPIKCDLTECIFSNNKAQKAGAILAYGHASNVAQLTITDCGFTANQANDASTYANKGGGAIYAGSKVVINLVSNDSSKAYFTSNTSNYAGGAIYFLGTLNSTGSYVFTSNTPEDIATSGGTNNTTYNVVTK